MIFVKGIDIKKLKKSPYYDTDCFDYPHSELSYLMDTGSNVIYVIGSDRIYETYCTSKDFIDFVNYFEKGGKYE